MRLHFPNVRGYVKRKVAVWREEFSHPAGERPGDPHRRATDGVWLLQPARRIWVAILFLFLCLLLGLLIAEYSRTLSDEQKSCQIQARGLKAGHYLVGTVADLHNIVSRPFTPQQQKQLDALPPKDKAQILTLYQNLNKDSFDYTWITNKQPKFRKC